MSAPFAFIRVHSRLKTFPKTPNESPQIQANRAKSNLIVVNPAERCSALRDRPLPVWRQIQVFIHVHSPRRPSGFAVEIRRFCSRVLFAVDANKMVMRPPSPVSFPQVLFSPHAPHPACRPPSPAPAGEGSPGEDIRWLARKHSGAATAFSALNRSDFCFFSAFCGQMRAVSRQFASKSPSLRISDFGLRI